MITVLTAINLPALLAAGLAGFGLGLFYFSSLWVAVQHLPDSEHPWQMMIWSFTIRLALCLGGFYLILRVNLNGLGWVALASSLLGFYLARLLAIVQFTPE